MTRFKYANVYAVHMTLAIIAMTLAWGHAFTQLANPVGTVFLIDEFVPFTNGTDPVGIGVGVIATEIMTALLVSIPLRRRLGDRRWRTLHSLAYASFTLLAGHVLLAGSDVGPLIVKIPVIALWASTVVAWLGVSIRSRRRRRSGIGGADAGRAAPRVRVQVDPDRCAGYGNCQQEAPEVFELRADGRLAYRSSVPDEQVKAVARAVKACPARAIALNRAEAALDRADAETGARRAAGKAGGSPPAGKAGDEDDELIAHVIDLRPR
jgi:ferredoxin/DMSO/TMAO reductase YedYZ heme-binding membrane subunit